MRRHGGMPDIVPNLPDAQLRDLYGPSADEIIAVKRFLALPRKDGQVQCPPLFMAWAKGELTGAELLARLPDDPVTLSE